MNRLRDLTRTVGFASWRRSFLADGGLWATLAVALLVVGFLVTAAPRSLERAVADDLVAGLDAADPVQRNLVFGRTTPVGAGRVSDPLSLVEQWSEELRAQLPESIDALIDSETYVVESPQFTVATWPDGDAGPFPTTLRFRYQEGIEDRLTVTDGEWSETVGTAARLVGTDCPEGVDPVDFVSDPADEATCAVEESTEVDLVLSAQTAADLRVTVGDRLLLRPATTDLAWVSASISVADIRFVVRVAGIGTYGDTSDPYWFADDLLARPRIAENPDFRLIDAAGLFAPSQFRSIEQDLPGVVFDMSFRYGVDAEVVAASDTVALADELDQLTVERAVLQTQLPRILRENIAQRAVTVSLLAVVVSGAVGAALAMVGVTARLAALRRRSQRVLLADRGASSLQLTVGTTIDALVAVLPAAVLGVGAAAFLVTGAPSSGRFDGPGVAVGTAIAAASVVAVVVAAARAAAPHPLAASRRWVARIVTVVVAVGGLLLVRRRTGADDAPTIVEVEVDWLLAAVPVALAVLAAVVLLLLLGPAVAGWGRLLARRGGSGWFVGVRRLRDTLPAASVPILALVVAVSGAAFAASIADGIDERRTLASWTAVGGDHRIASVGQGTTLPEAVLRPVEAAVADGSVTAAFGTSVADIRFASPEGDFVADVLAVDLASVSSLVRGADVDMVARPAIGSAIRHAADGPELPGAIVVGEPGGPLGPRPIIGDTLDLVIGGSPLTLEVVGVVSHFPGVGRTSVVLDRADLVAHSPERYSTPGLVVLGPGTGGEGWAEVAAFGGTGVVYEGRDDWIAAAAGDPLAEWVDTSLTASAVIALLTAIGVAVAAVVIAAPVRRRHLALYSLAGAGPKELRRVAFVEHVPTVAVAALLGLACGIATTELVGTAIDLDALHEGEPLSGVVAPVGLGVVANVALVAVTALATHLTARHDPSAAADVLRTGERDD